MGDLRDVWLPLQDRLVEVRDGVALEAATASIDDALLERHFTRKHGPDAYYGQAGRLG